MNNAIKVGMAFAGAAAIAVGGTAFTAANTLPAEAIMGSDSMEVTGVEVLSAVYNYSATSANLDEVVFTITPIDEDNSYTGTLSYTTGVDPTLLGNEDCGFSDVGDTGAINTVTCGGSGVAAMGWAVSSIDGLTFVVTTDDWDPTP